MKSAGVRLPDETNPGPDLPGKHDFNALAFDFRGTPIQYGRVLTATLNLILVGGVLFLVVKAVNRVIPPPKAPETDHELLAQIRDALRSR